MPQLDSLSGEEELDDEEIQANQDAEQQSPQRRELGKYALRQGAKQLGKSTTRSVATQAAGKVATSAAGTATKAAGSQLMRTVVSAVVSASLQVLAYIGTALLPILFIIMLIIIGLVIVAMMYLYFEQHWDYYSTGYAELFQNIQDDPLKVNAEIMQGTWVLIKDYFFSK